MIEPGGQAAVKPRTVSTSLPGSSCLKAFRARHHLSCRTEKAVQGGPGANRTRDTRFRRAVLYPLSYWALHSQATSADRCPDGGAIETRSVIVCWQLWGVSVPVRTQTGFLRRR